MKFTEECERCMEKQVLIEMNVYRWAKHAFATTNLNRKDST